MKKYILGFTAVFGLMGTVAFAQSFSTEGLKFEAPLINGRGNVGLPIAIGEIVFDTATPAGFFGYNGSGWTDMNAGANAVPSGTISAFGGVAAPTGYVLCDGASYTAAAQPTLAAALWDAANGKYAFGGSGTYPSGSFNVPDLRGRFLRGVDGTAGLDPDKASRTAMASGGNSGNLIGSVQGQATKKNGLTATSTDSGHSHTANFPTGGGGTNWTQPVAGNSVVSGTVPVNVGYANITTTIGAGDAETRPINANVNYIIKL